MATSYRGVYVHIVFSTKDRAPLLGETERERLFAYVATVLVGLKCDAVTVGGYIDHVHVILALPPGIALDTIVREGKSRSSRWAKRELSGLHSFAWQTGYAAFSVSRGNLAAAVRYVMNQEAHHRQVSFEDEYRQMLSRAEMEYDERYLFG